MGENSGGEEQQGRCEQAGGEKKKGGELLSIFSVNRNRPLGFRNCVV